MSRETAQSESKPGQTIFYKFVVSWLRLFQDMPGDTDVPTLGRLYIIDMMDLTNSSPDGQLNILRQDKTAIMFKTTDCIVCPLPEPQYHLFLHLILEYFPSRTGLSLLRLRQCKVLSVFCMRLYEVNIWISKELGYYMVERERDKIVFICSILMPPLWYSHQSWHSKIGNVMLPQIQLNKKCLLLNFNNQSCEEASQERLLPALKTEKNL